jgi:hypothetical protein
MQSRPESEAMTAIETTKESWFQAEVHRVAAEVALKSPERDAAKAEAYFDRALAVARKQQAKSWELRARLWRDQGKRVEARDLLAPVYGWFTEGFDTLDLKKAKALLEELAAWERPESFLRQPALPRPSITRFQAARTRGSALAGGESACAALMVFVNESELPWDFWSSQPMRQVRPRQDS